MALDSAMVVSLAWRPLSKGPPRQIDKPETSLRSTPCRNVIRSRMYQLDHHDCLWCGSQSSLRPYLLWAQ